MAEITAALVKELREMTGAGMMECKKALVEAEGEPVVLLLLPRRLAVQPTKVPFWLSFPSAAMMVLS